MTGIAFGGKLRGHVRAWPVRARRPAVDPSLAFRFSCINANACKECMMLIDGRVDYACTVRLKEGATTLAPLPKKALIPDLVTEIAPSHYGFRRPQPSLSTKIRSRRKHRGAPMPAPEHCQLVCSAVVGR